MAAISQRERQGGARRHRIATGGYPPAKELATITAPVVCTYGARSAAPLVRVARALVRAIPTATLSEIRGAGHAAAFDAPDNFVRAIVDATGTNE
jgi:pimeloyl-ACP methyl ester carboxylesterase